MRAIEFGVHEELSVNTGSSQTNNLIPINRLEYVITSKSGIFVCEDARIKKTIPIRLRAAVSIEEYNLIAGISEVGSELLIFYTGNIDRPILAGYKTGLVAVFHLLYSPVSHSLIASGSGVCVWQLKVDRPRNVIEIDSSMVRVIPRSNICRDFETSLLNPPSFDYQSEMLYVPTKQGFVGYDLDGNEVQMLSKRPTTPLTACAIAPVTKKLLTSDPDGFCVWKRGPILEKRIQGVASAVILVRFVDKSFAIFMDVNFFLYIMDIRVGKFWHVLTLPRKPTGMFVKGNELYVFQGPTVTRYRIVIPWDLWVSQTTEVLSIRRCPRLNEAARIVYLSQNKMVTMCSPKDGTVLTTASSARPANPCGFYYDRGLWTANGVYTELPDAKRDLLFVPMGTSKMPVFTTGDNPCAEEMFVDLNVTAMLTCVLSGHPMFCFATPLGELQFYDYIKLTPMRRFMIARGKILHLYYHEKTNSVICVFETQVAMFSLSSQKVIGRIVPIDDGRVCGLKHDYLFLGYQNGSLEVLRIDEKEIVSFADSKAHERAITGVAFANDFYVTVSLDQMVKIWEYDMTPICEIKLPFGLRAVEVLNGARDLVVGTDNEIMILPGRQIFGGDVDPKIDVIDNFDELEDELSKRIPMIVGDVGQNRGSQYPVEAPSNAAPKGRRQRRATIRAKMAIIARDAAVKERRELATDDERETDEEARRRKIAEMSGITDNRNGMMGANSRPSEDGNEGEENDAGANGTDGDEGDENNSQEGDGEDIASNSKAKDGKGKKGAGQRKGGPGGDGSTSKKGTGKSGKSKTGGMEGVGRKKTKGRRDGTGNNDDNDQEDVDTDSEDDGNGRRKRNKAKADNVTHETDLEGECEYEYERDEDGVLHKKKKKKTKGSGGKNDQQFTSGSADQQSRSEGDGGKNDQGSRSGGIGGETTSFEDGDGEGPSKRKLKTGSCDYDEDDEGSMRKKKKAGAKNDTDGRRKGRNGGHNESDETDDSQDDEEAESSRKGKHGTSGVTGTTQNGKSKGQKGDKTRGNSIEKSLAFGQDDENDPNGNEDKKAGAGGKKAKAKKKNKKKGKRQKGQADQPGNSQTNTDTLNGSAPLSFSPTGQVKTDTSVDNVLNVKERPLTPVAVPTKPPWIERVARRKNQRPGTPIAIPKPLFTLPTPEIVLDKVACINKIIDGETRLLPLLRHFGNEKQLRELYKQALEARDLERQFHERRLRAVAPTTPKGPVLPPESPPHEPSPEAFIILHNEKEAPNPNPTTQSVIIHLSVNSPEGAPRISPRRRINHLARMGSLGDNGSDDSEGLDDLIVAKNIQVKRQMAANSEEVLPRPKAFQLDSLKQPEPIQRLRIGIEAMTKTVPICVPTPRRPKKTVNPMRKTTGALVLPDIVRGVKIGCKSHSPPAKV